MIVQGEIPTPPEQDPTQGAKEGSHETDELTPPGIHDDGQMIFFGLSIETLPEPDSSIDPND